MNRAEPRTLNAKFMRTPAPSVALLELTNRCNLACVHCVRESPAHRGGDAMTLADWFAVIDDLASINTFSICFTGGEATAHPDLFPLIRRARSHRMCVSLKTNGILLAHLAPRLAAEGVGHMAVSLYGASAATHDRCTEIPGSFEKTVAGIRAARAAGVPVSLSVTLFRWNAHEAAAIKVFAESLDCQVKRDYFLMHSDLGRDLHEHFLSPDQIRSVEDVWPGASLPESQNGSTGIKICAQGFNTIAVTARGEILSCVTIRKPLGHVRDRGVVATWTGQCARADGTRLAVREAAPVVPASMIIGAAPPGPLSLDRYRTEATIVEGVLVDLTRKLSELRMERSGREHMAQWVRPAIRPEAPDAPDLSRSIALGSCMGLLLAALAIFLGEALDRSIKTADTAESVLHRRVLGVIPHFSVRAGTLIAPADRLVIAERSNVREAEAYRALAQKIDSGVERLLMVTSTEPQEGKSTTSANLAAALAELRRSVLLVSANLRRPSLHRIFELDESPGIFEVIAGIESWESAIHSTRVPRLDFLASGVRRDANVAAALSSEAFAGILRGASGRYDFVIVDVPPTAPVSDALHVARLVEGVLFVTMAGRVAEESAADVIRSIEDVGGRVIGIVMNDSNAVAPFYGYSESDKGDDDESVPRRRPRVVSSRIA